MRCRLYIDPIALLYIYNGAVHRFIAESLDKVVLSFLASDTLIPVSENIKDKIHLTIGSDKHKFQR